MNLSERFWSKVDKTDTCWLWTGSLSAQGYGRIQRGSRDEGVVLAHRLAWEWVNGPIPDGMQLDHLCYVHACVRPDHMQLATHGQNQENRDGATRVSKTGRRGVFLAPARSNFRYYTRVGHNGAIYSAGFHDDLEVATEAVRALRNLLHTNNLRDREAT